MRAKMEESCRLCWTRAHTHERIDSGQTCTGSHDQGPCCSAGGWCGGEAGKTDSEYCDPYSMQHQYSHGANLCDDSTPEATSHQDADCLTMTEVAKAWLDGVVSENMHDAKDLCPTAVIVASVNTYGMNCPHKFDTTVVSHSGDSPPVRNQGPLAGAGDVRVAGSSGQGGVRVLHEQQGRDRMQIALVQEHT